MPQFPGPISCTFCLANPYCMKQRYHPEIRQILVYLILVVMVYSCVDGDLLSLDPDAPIINDFTPKSGLPGSSVIIQGENFNGSPGLDSVYLNGYGAEVRSSSATRLEIVVPDDATTGPIVVIDLISRKRAISSSDFEVLINDNPVIDSLKPNHGPVGTVVWIYGQNFSSIAEENVLSFNGVESEVLEAYIDSLKTEVPLLASTGPVKVVVNGITAIGPQFAVESGLIEVSSINPTSGKVGISVTITGLNFGSSIAENKVSFNGEDASIVSANSSEIVAIVPENATTGPVVVTVGGFSGVGPTFTVEASPPQITSLNPTSGQLGSSVKILGTNFSSTAGENTVTFNGSSATVTSASANELVASVPEGASSGLVLVTVGGLVSNGVNFTVEEGPPQITSINPTSGVYNTLVTISGANFSDNISENMVFFNGKEAVINNATTTSLIATVPLGAGTGSVSVTTNGLSTDGPNFSYIKSAFVNTFAGNGSAGFADGSGASAQFNRPNRLTLDAKGQIILADFNNHSIRFINSSGQVSTIAGDGNPGAVNGAAANSRFNQPSGVAIDNSGNIYVADFGNNVIRKISTSNIVSTYAGNGQPGFSDGNIQAASFNGPSDIDIDSQGNLYVADTKNHAIRKIDTDGNVTTLAGNGKAGNSDGKGTSASFNGPVGICLDQANNIYVADAANHAIRKIDPGNNVSTIAGSDATPGSTDGHISVARFNYPTDIDTDQQGNLYVADYFNHKIRIIRTNDNVETLAGTGTAGFQDGPINTAQFNYPIGVAVQNSELIYVGDVLNHRVRVISFE